MVWRQNLEHSLKMNKENTDNTFTFTITTGRMPSEKNTTFATIMAYILRYASFFRIKSHHNRWKKRPNAVFNKRLSAKCSHAAVKNSISPEW